MRTNVFQIHGKQEYYLFDMQNMQAHHIHDEHFLFMRNKTVALKKE